MIGIESDIFTGVGALASLATLPAAFELLLATSGAVRKPLSGKVPDFSDLSLAVIVPAHDEEVLIARCVRSLFAAADAAPVNRDRFSVVVVADNCSDMTAQLAREAGARVRVRQNSQLRGKGYALRFAFDELSDEGFDGFLIVDADSVVSENLIAEVARALKGGADAVQTRYRVRQPLDTDRKRLMDVALLAFNVLRPKGREGWGLSVGILGNGFALSRQTLLDVPYSAESIVEDLEYHILLVNAGKRVRFADAATVYGDMPDDKSAQVSQRARWEGGRVRMAAAWIPRLTGHLLRGNLLVAEPLLELLTLPLAYLAMAALLLCALPIDIFRYYGCFLAALLLVHVAAAVALGGNARQSLAALVSAPAYLFWKLTQLGSILRSSRPEAQWLRTARPPQEKTGVPRV